MAEVALGIDGMHCGSCIRRSTQALVATAGVEVEEVRIGAARLKAPGENPRVGAGNAAVAKAGYSPRLER